MPDIDGTSPEGLTRREALKRGAAFGGALLWATPVVQAVGMSAAAASETSGNNCKSYCIKYEFTGGDDDLIGTWSELGKGSGNCLTCPPEFVNDGDELPGNFFNEFEVYGGTRKTEVYVRFPDSCSPADLEDPSPDLFYPGVNVAAKCGQNCSLQSPVVEADPTPGYSRVLISACNPPNGNAISHLELIITCCP